MTAPMLQIEALTKRFQTGGGFLKRPRTMLAVRDVSLTIAKGEVVGVVGESGCGKSTLARLVLRLLEPTSGRVVMDGTDLTSLGPSALRAARRRMAMVFQDPYSSLDPRFSVADVLTEPFTVQRRPLPPGQIAEMLTAVGLPTHMATSHPHQLSGGQRQRVGIARALALRPEFVVLDEPTASLDVSIQAQIINLLAGLRDQMGLTYLFISHDLGLVRYFCDRIVVMYLGAVVEILPSQDAHPRHPYTRALIDSGFAPNPARRRAIAPLSSEIPSPFDLPPAAPLPGAAPTPQIAAALSDPRLTHLPTPPPASTRFESRSMPFHILTAAFVHESNTFKRGETTLQDFRNDVLDEGQTAIDRFGDVNEELAGFLDIGSKAGWQITHTVSAHATPGARVARAAFDHIAGLICDGARPHRATLDGILLSLHGSMVPTFCEKARANSFTVCGPLSAQICPSPSRWTCTPW